MEIFQYKIVSIFGICVIGFAVFYLSAHFFDIEIDDLSAYLAFATEYTETFKSDHITPLKAKLSSAHYSQSLGVFSILPLIIAVVMVIIFRR